ncbi:MAG: type II toxin-antitoxin system VapC family toxin [Chloroflexi bacterium]|nr:type II toxin-antitoxin system VapC family toxin [Chloroflexota bacterium]
MKLLDVNLLLYAVDESSPLHPAARAWLEDVLSGSETIAFDWNVLLAFIRLTTRARLFAQPLTLAQAFDIVESWLTQSNVIVVYPTDRHAVILRELLEPLGAAGNLTTDAHLAAVAIEHGAELYSLDGDFSRFPGLRWVNPLQPR